MCINKIIMSSKIDDKISELEEEISSHEDDTVNDKKINSDTAEEKEIDSDTVEAKDSDNDSDTAEEKDNNNDIIEDDEVSVVKGFEKKANYYLTIDNKIKEYQNKINDLKDQKKPLEGYILKYLEKTDYGTVEFPNGTKLRRNKSETKESLKLDHFKDALKNELGDDPKMEKILKKMEELRETKVNVNLKRTNPRQVKPKKKKN